MPTTSAHGRWRKEDQKFEGICLLYSEFEASLDYIVSSRSD